MTAQAVTTGNRISSKLKDYARNAGMDTPQFVQKFAQERIAVRLFSLSEAANLMITGGTMYHWSPEMFDLNRSTSDIDIKSFVAMSHDAIEALVQKAAAIDMGDSVEIEVGRSDALKHEDLDQQGLRVHVVVKIGTMRSVGHLDFSIGSVPAMGSRMLTLKPVVKGQTVVPIRAQQWVYSIAEKLQTCCKFGLDNTRMKDYRDLYMLARKGYGTHADLGQAIREVFDERDMALPTAIPEGLDFIFAQYRQQDWDAYLGKLSPRQREGLPVNLQDVTYALEKAYMSALVPTDNLDFDEVFTFRA
ncbi:nucleotidyl transferase AbiEii/AbiGii toxin family protein [Agrobacterium sp. 22094]|uniref:nucleotidyl transferase AbiEii/AbiGii toxin family protein n=1 Tax=Agrobacterium sp. 22094 TaxID=3453872 RepID=UPI003F87294D